MDPLAALLTIAIFAGMGWVLLRLMRGKTRDVVCRNCGHVGRSKIHYRGNLGIEIVLWLLLIVPGLIYSLWRLTTKRQVCGACESEQIVPVDSPFGKKLLEEQRPI